MQNNKRENYISRPSLYSSFIDNMFQLLFYIAYRVKLLYNIIINPDVSGVYIAVWADSKILVIKNSYKPYYTLPCGGLQKHETPAQGAIRELFEEVKISTSTDDLHVAGHFLSKIEYMNDSITLFELNLEDTPWFQVDNREVVKADFITPDSALKMKLFPVVRDYLTSKKHITHE